MAPGGRSFVSQIKAFDVYRKVPKDLTEASVIGGSCSIFAYVVLAILFILEVRNYFTVEHVTSIEVDHGEDGLLQVNFNLTLPGLSCEFAYLELQNALGEKKPVMNARTIHKFSLDGTWQGSAASNIHEDTHHYYEGTDKDHYGNNRYAIELLPDTFQEVIDDHEVILVDFHAPWCSHCQHLAPIYQHAAHLVQQRSEHGLDAHNKHSVALATFDCTISANIPICREKHIQAYPTILVFRKSKNKVVGRKGLSEVHESYNGVREAENIANFVMEAYKEVVSEDTLLLKDGNNRRKVNTLTSGVQTRGCRIEGHLMVQKVPTKIVIKPFSDHHALNTTLLSVDHKINHLSFGKRTPSPVRKLIQESMEGAYAENPGRPVILAEGEEEVGFLSPRGKYAHEHYIKVVSVTQIPLSGRRKKQAYEYTINSHMHEANAEEESVPEIIFTFDLSPLRVVVREKSKRLIDELIKVMALIGGLFSCSIIFEGMFASVIYTVAKKLD